MPKFMKRPIVVEAIQFDGSNFEEIQQFVGKELIKYPSVVMMKEQLGIPTLEGNMLATEGDWIVKGTKKECWPVKPDIFEETYELVDDSTPLSSLLGMSNSELSA